MIYDLSPPISKALAVWPGDTPPGREVLLDIASGATVTLSTLHATVHLGSHADAPSHYGLGAPSIGERSIEHYLGPCQVVRAPARRGMRIGVDQIASSIRAERILIATGTYPDPTEFRTDFAALDPELVHRLADRGVRTIGIDTPSVDLFDSKELPTHRACLARDIAILEGLVLEGVPEGVYELLALPLRLVDFDASPVRAILRTWKGEPPAAPGVEFEE